MTISEHLREVSEKEKERGEALAQAATDIEVADDDVEQAKESLSFDLSKTLTIQSEQEVIAKLCKTHKMNATQVRKHLDFFPKKYELYGQGIPEVIKALRKERRGLKGNHRFRMSKNIDDIIDGYSEHITKCIDSIYWLSPYKDTLRKMNFNQRDLLKLHRTKDVETRREIIDSLCKYWEAELDQKDISYGKEYSLLHKEMTIAKKSFRKNLKEVKKTMREETNEFIIKQVCNTQGISARQIHDRMPKHLHDRTSWHSISKMIKPLDIVSLDGSYYKFNSDIKKNVYAYTAAFIDSDGYITMDRNHNPRVGLVATGDRGKAFMMEMKKALGGIGKLHLDQKSPQNTRPVNRLNFYSQAEVTELLTKCLPHFRMKKSNANLLLELIRMKKSYKKADWYKGRCTEIFKLMKYENHKDHVGYDFVKEDIDIETVAKLHDNCKMSTMDSLENIGGVILKSKSVMMAQEIKMKERMENPTLILKPRIEETTEEDQTSIQIDMDDVNDGDCCEQLKVKIIEDDVRLMDGITEGYETWLDFAKNMTKIYNDSYLEEYSSREAHDEAYAEETMSYSCEELRNIYGEVESIQLLFEEYDLCQQSNMGIDDNSKLAMLKAWQDQLKNLTAKQQQKVKDLMRFKNKTEEDAVKIVLRQGKQLTAKKPLGNFNRKWG